MNGRTRKLSSRFDWQRNDRSPGASYGTRGHRPLVIVLVAILVTLSPGCWRRNRPRPKPLMKTTIACTTQPESALVHVAVAKGYFLEEGLDAHLLIHTFGKAAMQTLLDRKAEFATVAETPIMFAALRGEPVKVIANIVTSTENNALVARRDRGITRAADLKGKRVGYTPGTTSDFFLDSQLLSLGLTRKDIHPVGLKPEEMEAAILSSKVDVVCTWNYPLTLIQRALGADGIVFFDRDIYTETFNIAIRSDLLTREPEKAECFLRALIKAEAFVADHPKEAQAMVATATHQDERLVSAVWGAFHFGVQLDQILMITLEDETRWAMKHHLVEAQKMPDYRAILETSLLQKVRAEAATGAQ